jgi:hypothetical protein
MLKKPASRQRSKAERKMMKLKVQFGRETRFDQPIWRIARSRVQWSPGIRVSLRSLAIPGRPKPIQRELTNGIFPEGSSP